MLHELLIGLFVTVTTPVTLMLLARAAVFRDRTEGRLDVPSRRPLGAGDPPTDSVSTGGERVEGRVSRPTPACTTASTSARCWS